MAPPSEFLTWIVIAILTLAHISWSKRQDFESDGRSLNHVKDNEANSHFLVEKSHWKSWSNWSICSRTCDGGATFRYRECKKHGECFGEKIQYKLCNTKPCPMGTTDFRTQQCSAYDKIPSKGQLHHWMPHISPKRPCALTCRSREQNFVKEMAPQVLDGTRCRDGSLDMCINGQCMPVGCDLKLGSAAKLDACGICSGDGSQCGQTSAYKWSDMGFSTCSKSCGSGHQSSIVVCNEIKSGAVADSSNCDPERKPAVRVRECNKQPCQAYPRTRPASTQILTHNQWSSDPWGPCTEECNGGLQARRVYCLQVFPNGTKQTAGDFHCTKHTQPSTSRRCNNFPCPQWHTSNWSECSVSCGRGHQARTVKCVDHKGYDSDTCDKSRKPSDKKVCRSPTYCQDSQWTVRPEDRPHSEQALPFVAPHPGWDGPMDLEQAMKFEDTPMFAIGPWSECSVSCGHGFRQRSVECKLYIKFSVKLVQLPDSECSDPRPVEREPCSKRPCSELNATTTQESIGNFDKEDGSEKDVEVTYSWHYEGYTACTKTCLGGVRHAIIRCFRDHDQSAVEERYCKNARKPAELKQSCNEVPCPPRWNTSDFTQCSQTCGGGTQTRTVQCVQELGSSPGDLLMMPMDACPYPPPRTQVLCNTVDCPAEWDVSPWTMCSRTCGKGLMERTVVCRQRSATGDIQDLVHPSSICPKAKPASIKSCFLGECPTEKNTAETQVVSLSTVPVSLSVLKGKGKANKLKVGGSAVLYEGTDLRLKCPVLLVDGRRPPVTWLKDGKPVVYSKTFKGHIKMSQLGAVKIKSLRRADAGTYTCISGPVKESIHLTVVGSKPTTPRRINPTATSFEPLYVAKSKNSTHKFYANSTDALRILQTVSQKTTPFSNVISESEQKVTPDRLKFYADQSTVPATTEAEIFEKDIKHSVNIVLELFGKDLQEEFQDFEDQSSPHDQRVEVRSKSGESSVTFEWVADEWSACSKTCGAGGVQTRSVECQVGLNGDTQLAKNILCLNAGLITPPATSQPCGLAECPEWRTESWEECEHSECFSLHTAIQKRNVSCVLSDGTALPLEKCPSESRPRDRRDCSNQKCTAIWITGPWSECTVTCGSSGIRSRLLKCVWYGTTDKPAGNMCRTLERPAIKETCENQVPCARESQCRDHFKYCDYANSLKLCRQKAYRMRCCRTCNAHQSV